MSSLEKLIVKRIVLLNNKLAEAFDIDIFTELYSTKMLDLTKYTTCISSTIDKNIVKFNILLNHVNTITSNDESLMNIIINKFLLSYKISTFDDFINNLEFITTLSNNNINIMLQIIYKYFKDAYSICKESCKKTQLYYTNWLQLYQHKIATHCDNVKYIYYKLSLTYPFVNNNPKCECITPDPYGNTFICMCKVCKCDYHSWQSCRHCGLSTCLDTNLHDTVDNFKLAHLEMDKLYNVIIKLLDKTPIIDNIKINNVLSDEEFQDTVEDLLTDSDDSDSVYKKTMQNTKNRVTHLVNSGNIETSQ